VIGRRAHEIIGLFKVPRKETLWCSLETEGETSELVAKGITTDQSCELLAQGTIWITAIVLGLTLRVGSSPPNPLPDKITVSFNDADGNQQDPKISKSGRVVS